MSPARRRSVAVVSTVLGAVLLTLAVVAVQPALPVRLQALVGLDPGPRDVPGAHHAFLQVRPGTGRPGVPVGWDPCRPIRYVVNPQGAPAGWQPMLAAALDELERASGLDLVDAGTTDARDFGGRQAEGPTPDPVLIGWADAAEVPGLTGDVAGLGGAVSVQDGDRRTFRTGSLVLDTEAFADLEDVPGDTGLGEIGRAIVLHELGHVVGLGHVDDPGELMHAGGVPRADLGPGDRAGLAALGALPCG